MSRRIGLVLFALAIAGAFAGCASIIGVSDDVVRVPSEGGDAQDEPAE